MDISDLDKTCVSCNKDSTHCLDCEGDTPAKCKTCEEGYSLNEDKICISGVSGNYKKSSSRGSLSGGAIAGIVIACVAIVAIVGFIFVFVVKGGIAAGSAASAVSSCSNNGAGVASNSNEHVVKF